MKTIEKEAATKEQAIEEGLLELGALREEVNVEVLEEGSRGMLGIGKKQARVRISVRKGGAGDGSKRAGDGDGKEMIGEVMENILNMMGIEHTIEVSENDFGVEINLTIKESRGLLIGKYGETLRSLEHIITKIAYAKTGGDYGRKLFIDINNYKKERKRDLEKKALEAAKRVKKSGRPFTFHTMQAYERKIVYTAIKNVSGVKYETKEEENGKKITLLPSERSDNTENSAGTDDLQ